jgi:hypothetical protein
MYFLIPCILLAYPADLFLSHYLKKTHKYPGEFEVWNDIYRKEINADIAIYGTSKSWVNFNSTIIENNLNLQTYNFGFDGNNFWMQYMRHLEYLKYNKPPKIIIMSVDVFILQKRKDLYEQDQFLPYMLWNHNIYRYTSTMEGFDEADYYVPLIRYFSRKEAVYEVFRNIISGEKPKYRHKGFRGMDWEWNNDLSEAMAKQDKYVVKLDKPSIELFEQFINECKKSNIHLILVFSPDYIDGQRFVANRKIVTDYYSSISEKYGITYLDYSNDEICFDKQWFYNANHLNRNGADFFTQKLVKDLSRFIKL